MVQRIYFELGGDYMAFQEVIDAKQRIIQEFVPGKQVTIAHVIANPKPDLFRKMGLEEKGRNAIGILTITPGEGTIIAADSASKSGDIEIGVIEGLQRILGFFPTDLTRS